MSTITAAFDFSGRTALVTGGTRGIGKAIVATLAELGATVYFCGTNRELGGKVALELEDTAGKVRFLPADISSLSQSQELVKTIIGNDEKLDFLINNAGITRDNLILRMKEDEWDEVMAVNLKGCFNCTKAAVKGMVKQRFGRLVFLSSVVGIMGNAGQANYAASKAGIIGFSKAMARELAARQITSNVIAPGYIQTEMTEGMTDKAREAMIELIPSQRLGTVGDIASAVAFLLSPLASYITGQVLQVNGGLLIS
ncbi:MAG: 3-oxoacyl-[acyl-carrier-protein] reductase [Deltaproteobacteria bacterium]|nr:3-oxoacyl-[acyl-carrier-protein] reductase [Candidatus Anaeroferrophillus wilburensis]MBN2889037.1 3-oxoacyl-[acyl-carrier-protein] reductase [Deltaproteobacteria bacterium]